MENKVIHLMSLGLILFSILSFYFSTFPRVCDNEDIDPLINFSTTIVTAVWCIIFIIYVSLKNSNNLFIIIYLSLLLSILVSSVVMSGIINKDISSVVVDNPIELQESSLGLNVSVLLLSIILPMLLIVFPNISPTKKIL